MGLIMLSSLTADLEASLVPVIYLTVTHYLMLETLSYVVDALLRKAAIRHSNRV